MSWWEWIIVIVTYFVTMWTSRFIFTILIVKVFARLMTEMQSKLKENVDSLKATFSNKGENE